MLAPCVDVERLFDVGPGAFQPPPRVWSAVVRAHRAPHAALCGEPTLRAASSPRPSRSAARRCATHCSAFFTREQISACGLDPGARAETLAPESFNTLAQTLDRARP